MSRKHSVKPKAGAQTTNNPRNLSAICRGVVLVGRMAVPTGGLEAA
jgi:hypothetical protein